MMTHPIDMNVDLAPHHFEGSDSYSFIHSGPNTDAHSPPFHREAAFTFRRRHATTHTPKKNTHEAWSTSAGAHDCSGKQLKDDFPRMPIEEIAIVSQVREDLAASAVIDGDLTSTKLDRFAEDIRMVASSEEAEEEADVGEDSPQETPTTPTVPSPPVTPPSPTTPPPAPRKKRGRSKSHDLLEEPMGWINHPQQRDVLFGRGGMTNKHKGNLWFGSEIVRKQDNGRTILEMYTNAKKHDKVGIARLLVKAVQDRGGRFLAKDKANGKWYEKPIKDAIEKAKQKIREYELNASNRKTPHNYQHGSNRVNKRLKANQQSA